MIVVIPCAYFASIQSLFIQEAVARYHKGFIRSSVYLASQFILVHSSSSVKLFHDGGDLIEEPGL